MHRLSTLCLCVFLLVLGVGVAGATSYYVDSVGGSDSNSGTAPDQAWKTIAKVNTVNFAPGDNCYFKCGSDFTGTTTLVIGDDDDGTEASPITFATYGTGAKPKFRNSSTGEWTNAIEMTNCVWVVLDGIYAYSTRYAGVRLTNADYCTVKNCEVYDTGMGIELTTTEYTLITQNYCHNMGPVVNTPGGDDDYGGVGIWLYSGENEVSYNTVKDCRYDSYDYGYDGGCVEYYSMGTLNNCYIHHNWGEGNEGFWEVGGVDSSTCYNHTFAYNVSYDYGYFNCMHLSGTFGLDIDNVKVEHNTVVRTSALWNVVGFDGAPDANTYKLKNNVFHVTGTGNGAIFDGYSGFTHDYNCFYPYGGDTVGISLNSHEIQADPQFVDYNNKNYHLQSTSPCRNAGTDLGYTVDFEGNPVPSGSAPDMGAYEYQEGPSAPVANFSGTPTSGTVPLTVNFTDTSSGTPTSWSWSFGDGGTSTAQNPSHQYTNGGDYTVSLTATNALGNDTETKTSYITVEPAGLPAFVAAGTVASGAGAITPALPSGIAANDILLLFLETANQAISISNQNGGTWTAVTNSPQGTGTAGGTSATRLTVFWSRYNGTQGAPTTSDSGNHQLGRIVAYRGCATSGNPWDVTAGGVEATSDTSGAIPGATTTVGNTLVVAAISTDKPDAAGTANFSAWANSNLTIVTELTDNTVVAGNGGGLAVARGGKASAGAYGDTTVTLATSAIKAMMSIALKPATLSPPVANFTGNPTSGYVPLTVNFTDTSTNSPTSWSWNFGDGGTSTAQSPSHQYASAGTYTVTLTATNAAGSDPETKTNYITANALPNPPVANFSGSPTSGTAPLTVNFTDSSTNSPTSWSWTFGDGGTSTAQNPSHQYTSAGNYTVSLTATNAGGSDGETKTNYITVTVAPPVANFTGTPTSGTAPLTVNFTDSSTNSPTSWSWNFGDGGASTAQNPSHQYTSAGNYTVSLTATNAGGSDGETKTNYITVTSGPTEVTLYPNEFYSDPGYHPADIISGTLSNVQADDNVYFVTSPHDADDIYSCEYRWSTGYTRSQVSKIKIEFKMKSSRSASPAVNGWVRSKDGSGPSGDLLFVNYVTYGTTEITKSVETTNINKYMGTDGSIAIFLCGCPQDSNDYNLSMDLCKVTLTLN